MSLLRSLRALGAGALLWGAAAWAEGDAFFLGDGHAGPLVVTASGTVVNQYALLAQPVEAGGTSLAVSTPSGFAAGDLVMVLQSTGAQVTLTSGDSSAVDLTQDPVGHFELARLSGVTASTLTLTSPLLSAFDGIVTQVVLVPEYTTVLVPPGASLTALPWNGLRGGVLAFLATGNVDNEGSMTVQGMGDRGGGLLNNTVGSDEGSLDQNEPNAAHKGEGILPARYSLAGAGTPMTSGRGNVGPAGGGANPPNAGGAGGGNGGQGGAGGIANNGDVTGGLGGSAMRFNLTQQLLFGGGGGAGDENNNVGSSGASGGGVLFVRVASLSGSGVYSADGANVVDGDPGTGWDGAGGGGAGGTVSIRVQGDATCGGVSANGGNGGSPGAQGFTDGPGGGGGGGQVLLQAASGSCPVTTLAGVPGQLPGGGADGAGPAAGATDPQSVGSSTALSTGFALPDAPSLQVPASGAHVLALPTISGQALPGVQVLISLDGAVVASVPSDGAGAWSWDVTVPLVNGGHDIQLAARTQGLQSLASAPSPFVFGSGSGGRGPAGRLNIGWGCGSAPAELSWVAASLALLAGLCRRRRV